MTAVLMFSESINLDEFN